MRMLFFRPNNVPCEKTHEATLSNCSISIFYKDKVIFKPYD